MQLVNRENALESLKTIKPGESFYFKTGESITSALAFAMNGIIALEQLFKLNIQKTDANAEIIDKIIEDYQQHVTVKEMAIAKAITEELGEEVYSYYSKNGAHFTIQFNPSSGIINLERIYCANCDSK